jgi:uncharacterized protein
MPLRIRAWLRASAGCCPAAVRDAGAPVNTVGQILAGVFVAGLVGLELLFTPRLMRRLRAAERAGRSGVRLRLIRLIALLGWPTAALAVVVLLIGGLSWQEIGFARGDLSDAAPVLIGAVVGLAGSVVLARTNVSGPRVVGNVDLLVPRTLQERRWFAAAAVTAGITEEITYRAVPIQLVLSLLDNRAVAVVAAAVVFGLAHRYQGPVGMLMTGVLALLLGWLYVATGSLWPGMVLHVLIDLRLLLVQTGKPSKDEIAPDGVPVLRSRVDGRPLRMRAPDESH